MSKEFESIIEERYKKIKQRRNKNTMNGSWKTTVFGAGGLLVALANIASMYLDGDPKTNPDWSVYVPLIATSIANILSKDYNVTNAPHPTQQSKKV